MQEARSLRELSYKKWEKKLKELNFTKDKLFASSDATKWGITDYKDLTEILQNRHDKAKIYPYLLPNATKEVDKLREEAEYFTN